MNDRNAWFEPSYTAQRQVRCGANAIALPMRKRRSWAKVAFAAAPSVTPDQEQDVETDSRSHKAPRYRVITWNDPINLMSYVTHVFQRVFGWDRPTAEKHMLEVHHRGKSVVAIASMEKAEHFVHQLQAYSLHATMEPET